MNPFSNTKRIRGTAALIRPQIQNLTIGDVIMLDTPEVYWLQENRKKLRVALAQAAPKLRHTYETRADDLGRLWVKRIA